MPENVLNSLPIGTIVHKRYRIISIVGRGGLGTVYQVVDILYGKQNVYALKELIDQSSGARKQFEMESQWLQSLDHNHIPKVREHFEWHQRLYLVMDFVDGENLEQKLIQAGGKPFPEAQVLRWIMPVCDALQYLHTRVPPILHRDIKPANIVVTPGGHVVLVDLGIAKAHLPGANQTGTFARKAGTEGYAAPEQYSANGQTGPWSDVYGLGATLYQLLTGRVPPTAVERVTLDSSLIQLQRPNSAISSWISAALLRALALRPSERFQSVQAFAQALSGPVSTISALLPNSPPALRAPSSGQSGLLTPLPPAGPLTPPFTISTPGATSSHGAVYPSTARSILRTPTPPALAPNSWPDLGGASIRPTPAPGPSQPGQITPFPPVSSPTSISRPEIGDVPARTRRDSQKLSEEHGQTLKQLQEEVNAEERRTTKPRTAEVERSRSRLRSPWLIGAAIFGPLLVIAIIAGIIYSASAPPDRSSPRVTVTGYFAAVQAQDYSRAWQYSADIYTNVTSQSNFIANLRSDDAQLGRIKSVSIQQLNNDSTNSATAAVNVVRADDPTSSISYSLELGLYNGSTWLINNITAS